MDVTLLLQDGWTALMFASQNGHTEVVKFLIEANASVDIQNQVICYCVYWYRVYYQHLLVISSL